VEVKDRPPELGLPEFLSLGKTVGLMLRMCQSIYHSGKLVILASGFCVLKGIIELKKVGVFVSALIKKHWYWPKDVDGNVINTDFSDKDVGDADAWPGELDGVQFHLFCMKEPDYIMSLMLTYGMTSPKHGKSEKSGITRMHMARTSESHSGIPRSWQTTMPTVAVLMTTTTSDKMVGQSRVLLSSPHGVPFGGQSESSHSFLPLQKSTRTLHGPISKVRRSNS
jgi:hypothetical protein